MKQSFKSRSEAKRYLESKFDCHWVNNNLFKPLGMLWIDQKETSRPLVSIQKYADGYGYQGIKSTGKTRRVKIIKHHSLIEIKGYHKNDF